MSLNQNELKKAFKMCMFEYNTYSCTNIHLKYLNQDQELDEIAKNAFLYSFINKFEFEDDDSSGSSDSSFEKKNPFGKGPGVRVGNDKRGGKTSTSTKGSTKGKSKSEIFDTDLIGKVDKYYDSFVNKINEKKNIFNMMFNTINKIQI